MPAIQIVRHQAELEGLLWGLGEERPDWDSLIRRAFALVQDVELHDVYESYEPGQTLRANPLEPLFRIVPQMEQVIRTRDRQRARLWVESTMRVLEQVGSHMHPWPLRAAAAAR